MQLVFVGGVSELRELRQLGEETRQLKQIRILFLPNASVIVLT